MLALSQHLYSAQGRPCQTLSRIIPRQAELLPGPAQLWIQPLLPSPLTLSPKGRGEIGFDNSPALVVSKVL